MKYPCSTDCTNTNDREAACTQTSYKTVHNVIWIFHMTDKKQTE